MVLSCYVMLSCLQKDHVDEDCITELSVHHGTTKEEMRKIVKEVTPIRIYTFI